MKLLRDSVLLHTVRRLLAGRRGSVRAGYTVTVPAPLAKPAGSNVIELHRRAASPVSGPSTQAHGDALPSSVHLALVSSR
ncbi:hypothetical protein B0E46_03610 [Rhodanobacter sp. B04]|uniref:hypothetical protein n=1 Tax=Rhodanobacter sp. B04 TaxID=1945860 RepID=UPI000987C4DE|nr:hypothetical protein [Rhodanobacter sp. B04]OOG65443.1 hypothetical protein B0E46_03610 [Rhodanobacter sp. B04]